MLRESKGFTLVKLIIILVILAILTVIGYPDYINFVKAGQAEEAKSVIGALSTTEKIIPLYTSYINQKYVDQLKKYPKEVQRFKLEKPWLKLEERLEGQRLNLEEKQGIKNKVREYLKLGMTENEVRSLLGKPLSIYNLESSVVWMYHGTMITLNSESKVESWVD